MSQFTQNCHSKRYFVAIHRSANTFQNPRDDRRFVPSISDALAPRSDLQHRIDVMHLKVRGVKVKSENIS